MTGRVFVLKPSTTETVQSFRRRPSSLELAQILGAPAHPIRISRKRNCNVLFVDQEGQRRGKRFNLSATLMSGVTMRVFGTAALWVPGKSAADEYSIPELTRLVSVLAPEPVQSLKIGQLTNGDWFTLLEAINGAFRVLKAGYRRT